MYLQFLDTDGAAVAAAVPSSASWTRNLNAGSTFSATVPSTESTRRVSPRYICRAYEDDGTCVFAGRFEMPGKMDANGGETITISAQDPLAYLARRYLVSSFTTGASETEIDTILSSIFLTLPDALLYVDTTPTRTARQRTYWAGKNVGEIVSELAELEQGFFYRCDPLTSPGSNGEFAELWMDESGSGTDRPEIVFAIGEGTANNIAEAEISQTQNANRVIALGAGNEETQLTHFAEATTVQAELYGNREAVESRLTVQEPVTLQEHAENRLEYFRRVQVSVVPNAETPTGFEVGDTIRFYSRGRSDALTVGPITQRVTSFTKSYPESGEGILTAVTLENTAEAGSEDE